MSRLPAIIRHLWRDLVHRSAANAALEDELASYVDLRIDERVRAGERPEAARRAVRLEVGGTAGVTEAVRDTRRTATIETILRDARFAFRALLRVPAFTASALLTLALGLGGATAIFSVVDTVLLRSVPGVRDPGTLVSLDRLEGGVPGGGFGYPDYVDFQAGSRSLDLAAAASTPLATTFASLEPQRLRGALVTGNYFHVLGARTVLGRPLSADDETARASVVVVSHGLWQRAYGGAPSAVGATIHLGGSPMTIVGVVAPKFRGAELGGRTDVWAPLSLQPILLSRMSVGVMQNRSAGWLSVFGRLEPGATIPAARSEIDLVTAHLAADHPITNQARTVRLRSGVGLDDEDRQSLRQLLGLLSAAAVLFLLLACANVAGLLIVRTQRREREMAIRLALGATRRRIAGHLLIEGAVLVGAASLVGVVIARVLAGLATAAQPTSSLLRRVDVVLSSHAVAGVLAATVVVTGLIVLAPALRLGRLVPMDVLRDGRSGAGRGRARTRRILVAVQVAVSLALLSASALVGLAVRDLRSRDPGYDGSSLVMLSLDLAAQGYSPGQGLPFYRALIDRLQRVPSFQAVSFAKTVPPLDVSDGLQVFRAGEDPPAEELRARPTLGLHVYGDPVAPTFFTTLGVRLVAGREFTSHDDAAAPLVAIVNAALAQSLWPNESAIGRRIAWPAVYSDAPVRLLQVIGVVPDFRYTSLIAAPTPTMFYPILQDYDGRVTLVARSAGHDREALIELRAAVHAVDPTLPITEEQTMRERMAASLWEQQLLAGWLGFVGVLALVLAFVGLYGVIAQIIGQRQRELSVRLALGASPRRLLGKIVTEGGVIMLSGLAAGIPLTLLAVNRVEGQLEGMDAAPLTATFLAIGVIAAAMLLATVLPARRAAALNPVDALRAD